MLSQANNRFIGSSYLTVSTWDLNTGLLYNSLNYTNTDVVLNVLMPKGTIFNSTALLAMRSSSIIVWNFVNNT